MTFFNFELRFNIILYILTRLTAPFGIQGHAILAILLRASLALLKNISPFSNSNALHLSIPASILRHKVKIYKF